MAEAARWQRLYRKVLFLMCPQSPPEKDKMHKKIKQRQDLPKEGFSLLEKYAHTCHTDVILSLPLVEWSITGNNTAEMESLYKDHAS